MALKYAVASSEITIVLELEVMSPKGVLKESKKYTSQMNTEDLRSEVRRFLAKTLKIESRYSWLRGTDPIRWTLISLLHPTLSVDSREKISESLNIQTTGFFS